MRQGRGVSLYSDSRSLLPASLESSPGPESVGSSSGSRSSGRESAAPSSVGAETSLSCEGGMTVSAGQLPLGHPVPDSASGAAVSTSPSRESAPATGAALSTTGFPASGWSTSPSGVVSGSFSRFFGGVEPTWPVFSGSPPLPPPQAIPPFVATWVENAKMPTSMQMARVKAKPPPRRFFCGPPIPGKSPAVETVFEKMRTLSWSKRMPSDPRTSLGSRSVRRIKKGLPPSTSPGTSRQDRQSQKRMDGASAKMGSSAPPRNAPAQTRPLRLEGGAV